MDPLDEFPDSFNQLDNTSLNLLGTIYHPDICFNDPAHTLGSLPVPKRYFESLYENIVRKKMAELTGTPETGPVQGLMNQRTLGLYFSLVNFYFRHDRHGTCTHLLAEVSNTPWNERPCYAHNLSGIVANMPDNRNRI